MDIRQRLPLSGMDSHAPELARKWGLGLEVTDFCYAPMLDDPATLPAVREKMAGIDHFWLHAPFAELAPCAVDPLVREVTARRYRQALSAARQLGIRRLVIHSGYIPLVYFPEWFTEQSVAFWREFLPEVPEDMVLALENVMDETPQLMTDIIRQVDDPRLGLCLDVGHANTCASRTPPMEWIAPMAPYLRHVHLHNNLGDWDLHSSLGEGSIPMQQILAALLEQCPEATWTIENQDCAPSLAWLVQQGYLSEE